MVVRTPPYLSCAIVLLLATLPNGPVWAQDQPQVPETPPAWGPPQPAPSTEPIPSEPIYTPPVQIPSPEKQDASPTHGIRSKFAPFGTVGIGGIWNYAISTNAVLSDDGSSTAQASLVRAAQAQFVGGLGVSYYILDVCRSQQTGSCADFLGRVQLVGGYQFSRQAPTIMALVGLETDVFFTAQRRVALTAKVELGYEHLFLQDMDTQQATIAQPFWLDPSHSNAVILAASLGALVHLGTTPSGGRYSIAADVRGYFSGGWFGLLIPVEFRYRF